MFFWAGLDGIAVEMSGYATNCPESNMTVGYLQKDAGAGTALQLMQRAPFKKWPCAFISLQQGSNTLWSCGMHCLTRPLIMLWMMCLQENQGTRPLSVFITA